MRDCRSCGADAEMVVEGECVECAVQSIRDDVARQACMMAITHLIADAIQDPTLGMPSLRRQPEPICEAFPQASYDTWKAARAAHRAKRDDAFEARIAAVESGIPTVCDRCVAPSTRMANYHGEWLCPACNAKAYQATARPAPTGPTCRHCPNELLSNESKARGTCYDCAEKP